MERKKVCNNIVPTNIILLNPTTIQYNVSKRVETFNVLRASGQGVTIRGLLNTLAITI